MTDDDGDRRRRAAERRARIVLRKTTLEDGEHDLNPIRGNDAITLVTRLSASSWSITGLPMPGYARGEIPCRFVPAARWPT